MLKFVHRVRFRFLKQVLFYYRSDESDKDHDSSGKSKDASSRPGPSQPFISTLDSPCEGPSTSFTEPCQKQSGQVLPLPLLNPRQKHSVQVLPLPLLNPCSTYSVQVLPIPMLSLSPHLIHAAY